MPVTPKWGFSLLTEGMSGADITFNEGLTILESLTNCELEDFQQNTPPGAPTDGMVYVTGSSPTGDWSGQAGKVAVYYNGWHYFDPVGGLQAFDKTGKEWLAYSSVESEWHPMQERWSTTEHWTGQYRTVFGGSTQKKVYAKVVRFGPITVPGTLLVNHSIVSIDWAYQCVAQPVAALQTNTAPRFNVQVGGGQVVLADFSALYVNNTSVQIETTNPAISVSQPFYADVRLTYCKTS